MSLLTAIFKKLQLLLPSSAPDAAKTWQQAGESAQHAYWLFAVPVHLLLGRDSFFLSAPAPLEITNDERVALIASLNQHFSGLGLYFYTHNAVWFLGLDIDPKITTTPVGTVVNQDVAPYLPTGEGALSWAKLQNEIQMLLFNHSVNEAREAQGQTVINSLWCYGLGKAEVKESGQMKEAV